MYCIFCNAVDITFAVLVHEAEEKKALKNVCVGGKGDGEAPKTTIKFSWPK